MIEYVVGFLFDRYGMVALIEKQRPEWQRGKLNGLGGKIEGEESPTAAMAREAQEEAGVVDVTWERFCVLRGANGHDSDYVVHVFRAFLDADVTEAYGARPVWNAIRTMTDERVAHVAIDALPRLATVPNLVWLVHMALSTQNGGADHFVVDEGVAKREQSVLAARSNAHDVTSSSKGAP